MLKPYSIVQETEDEITYEFKTGYLWILHSILILGLIAFVTKNAIVGTIAGIAMIIYFLTVSLQYRRLGRLTKKAALYGSVKYSGSKWSFKNPLKVTIQKTD